MLFVKPILIALTHFTFSLERPIRSQLPCNRLSDHPRWSADFGESSRYRREHSEDDNNQRDISLDSYLDRTVHCSFWSISIT